MSLPKGWREIPLEKVVDILDSKRKPINNKERANRTLGKKESELYPYYGATGNTGYIDDFLFDEELVLLGEDGVPFYDPKKHKAYIINGKTWVNNHAHVLRAKEGITINSYLNYFLNAFDYHGYVNGATRLKLNQSNMKKIPIILPPLNQQKQIAQKLDKVLARVERIKMALDNTPTTIKRFRQSVLALAVSGGLSDDKDWESLTIDDVVHVKGGKRLPKGEQLVFEDTGFPYIKAGQLKNGTVNPNKQEYLTKEVQQKISKYIVKTGDVYITVVGACIGDAGKIPKEFNNANLTENAVKLCEFKKELDSDFLAYWIRSYHIQSIISRETKSGAQGKLAIKRIKTLPFYLPPLEEQKVIVKKVETLFALADNLEAKVNQAQKRVDRLTQSILAKAFRGEL